MKSKLTTLVATALLLGHIAPAIADESSAGRTFGDRDFEIMKSGSPGAYSSEALILAQADSDLPDMGSSAETAATPQYTQAQINEMMNNPLGELWMLFTQNDTTSYKGDALDFLGEDDKVFNTTSLMPVMAMQLTENWKYIMRPVVPIHYWDAPSVSRGNTQYPGGGTYRSR